MTAPDTTEALRRELAEARAELDRQKERAEIWRLAAYGASARIAALEAEVERLRSASNAKTKLHHNS